MYKWGRRVFIQTISQVNLTKLGVGEGKWNLVFPFQPSQQLVLLKQLCEVVVITIKVKQERLKWAL